MLIKGFGFDIKDGRPSGNTLIIQTTLPYHVGLNQSLFGGIKSKWILRSAKIVQF